MLQEFGKGIRLGAQELGEGAKLSTGTGTEEKWGQEVGKEAKFNVQKLGKRKI